MSKCKKGQLKRFGLRTTSAIAILSGVFGTSSAYAQTAAAPAPSTTVADNTSGSEVQEVVVTGVRGKPRSVLDSPTPVDVVGSKELIETGQPNLYADLQTLVPSFNEPFRAGAGTGTVVQTGSLRGLDPDQTLVLVDGLRFHRTALINTGAQIFNGTDPVDLTMVPESGVDHIEVLREGAAAQYGSDAVAGVINIILKDAPGGSLSAQYGQNFDRSDGQLLQVLGNYGFRFSDSGSLNFFYTGIKQDQSNRTYAVANSVLLYPNLPQYAAEEAAFPRNFGKAYGQDPYIINQLGYNAHDQLGSVEIYSDATLTKKDSIIPYPLESADTAEALPQVYPNGFYAQNKLRELDGQIAVGARGLVDGWNWDLSSTAGEDHAKETVDQDINASLGPTSPTAFYLGTLISQEWDNSLDLTRKLDLGNAGSLQASFGLQDRVERFEIDAGDPTSYEAGTYTTAALGTSGSIGPGAYATPGFQPSNAGSWERNIIGAYGELGYSPTQKLFIDLSGRYEDYSDSSGGSLIGKLDGRYELTNWFSVRGSFGNGFHAPTLAQEHYSHITESFSTAAATLGQIIPTETLPTTSTVAKALGATPLRPETSVDASIGFTLRPTSSFNLTVDGYEVDVDHRIALTGVLSGPAINTILAANGLQPGLSAQYFTNAINTETVGVDIVGTYHHNFQNWGNLRLSAAFNYNNTVITHVIANPPALSALGSSYVLFDRLSRGYLTTALPKDKVILGANWTRNKFEVNLQEVVYGDYRILNDTPSLDRYFPSTAITNLALTYHITPRVALSVGANNLFDVYPPAKNLTGGLSLPTYGQNQYNGISPIGITGGSYYGRIQVAF